MDVIAFDVKLLFGKSCTFILFSRGGCLDADVVMGGLLVNALATYFPGKIDGELPLKGS